MTSGPSVPVSKGALRERGLAARAALPAVLRAEASRTIAGRLLALPELADARSVLGYAAFGTEVDLDPYLAAQMAAGVAVHLPWVDGDELRVARVRDLAADLEPGWSGVREPRPGARLEVPVTELDAVIAPGLAFDRDGRRLGYGGGHFDRLLVRLRPGTVVVGVAFDAQLVGVVPVEVHDVPMGAVVTEARTARTGAHRATDRP